MITIIILIEVMDKEPTLLAIWAVAFIIGVLGYFVCTAKYHFAFFFVPIASIFATAILSEIHDPHVGEAILREAGLSYVIQSYVAIIVSVVGPIIGGIKNYRCNLTNRSK